MSPTSSGCASTFLPIRQKVAWAWYRASSASTRGVQTGSGPSSKVSAMCLPPVRCSVLPTITSACGESGFSGTLGSAGVVAVVDVVVPVGSGVVGSVRSDVPGGAVVAWVLGLVVVATVGTGAGVVLAVAAWGVMSWPAQGQESADVEPQLDRVSAANPTAATIPATRLGTRMVT